MSQETGIFSVRRPRETLGGVNPNVSSLPMPSSALKRSNSISNMQTQQQQHHQFKVPNTTNMARSMSGSRMSLAPGRPNQPVFQRSSSGSNLVEMGGQGTAQRNSSSSNNLLGSAGASRKSFAPVAATPARQAAPGLQLPQMSTQRRSSVYSSARHSSSMGQIGHQSFFTTGPAPAGVPRDPRPLKDRSYQAQIGNELMDYLTHNNFEMEMKHSLTQRTMVSPTQKDFNLMFQWLYNRIDPAYRFMRNMDQEVPPILKQLRYPFERSITKSQLTAVGGQNWHTFLGMLHWMMQLARMMDQYGAGGYDEACITAGFDVTADRIVFDFLADAYHTWLTMDEDQDDQADEVMKKHVDAMAAKFDKGNAKYLEQVKMLEAEQRSLQDRIDELGKTGPRLAKLDEQIKIMEADEKDFGIYKEKCDAQVERRETRIQLLQQEIEKAEAELAEADEDRATLQTAVDRQGISVEEIDRMNSERERLQRGGETAKALLEESKTKLVDAETDASQKLEALEKAVREYNSMGYRVSVIPESATRAKGKKYELELCVNSGPNFRSSRSNSETAEPDRLLSDANTGYQAHQLLSLDMKGDVKSRLVALRREVNESRNATAEADMKKKDLLDEVKSELEEKQQEIEESRYKLRAAEEEYEKTREITNAQKMASDAQIEKLEKELARMRTTMTESVQLMEQREMNTNIEYEQLTLRAAALREELHTEIERMLNDIIRFKVHVQKGLEDYENFVGEEVERELEEGDEGLEDDGQADETREEVGDA